MNFEFLTYTLSGLAIVAGLILVSVFLAFSPFVPMSAGMAAMIALGVGLLVAGFLSGVGVALLSRILRKETRSVGTQPHHDFDLDLRPEENPSRLDEMAIASALMAHDTELKEQARQLREFARRQEVIAKRNRKGAGA
jgi:hypothetical protein